MLNQENFHPNYSMEDTASFGASNVPLLLTVLFLVLGFLTALRRRRNAADPPLPPGPRGLPFLGYLPFLQNLLHRQFAEVAKTYGPIYKLWLGNKLWVVLTSPSLVKEISRDHDVVFANRDATVAASIITFGGKDIAFAEYGPYWKKMRKVFVREMLSNSSLDAGYNLRREEVKKSISSLYINAGLPAAIRQLSLFLLINQLMAMLWGHSVREEQRESLSSEFREAVGVLMMVIGKTNISDLFPVLARFDLQGVERQAKKIRERLDDFIDSVIASAIERRANKGVKKEDEVGGHEKTQDILQILLDHEMKGEENSSSTTKYRDIKAVLTDIMIGGTDTTATMVEWVMTELFLHKPVLEKVMEELTEVVGMNSLVEEFHLPKLTYLDAVIKETLRLHPALPLLVPRCPGQSVTVGGYTIPKGTKVFVNMWAIQRDPQLWENPLDFKPERFLENPGEFDFSGNNFAYLPFGTGRRICAGIPLAEKMLKYILASFLHSFEWELPEGTKLEVSDSFGIVTKKGKPLAAIPRPRLSNSELYK